MHIELKKGVFLCSDVNCYWIQQEWMVKKNDKESVRTKLLSGYTVDLEHVMESYFDKEIRSSEVETFEELAKLIKKTRGEIRKWYRQLEGKDNG